MNPLFMMCMTHGGSAHSGHGSGGHKSRSGQQGRAGQRPGGTPPWAAGWRGGPFSGFGFPFGPPRSRAGRGDVRAAVIVLLAEQPRHGYEIITEVVERSEGRWQLSPGSVYPVLKRLATEGLVRAETDGDRRVFELTEAGRRYYVEHADELGEPWAEFSGPSDAVMALFDAARQSAGALWQVVQSGNEEQVADATAVLVETKRALYRVLAGEALDDESDDPFVREAVAEEERKAEDEAFSDDKADEASETSSPDDESGESPREP